MFIESFRQAHGQIQSNQGSQGAPQILVTKEGNFYYIIGGLGLIASFFLPAASLGETSYFPFQSIVAKGWSFKLLPLLYLLGLSTTLLIATGRFRKQGVPPNVLYLHLLLSLGLILGSGVFFHMALLEGQQRFGMALLAFPILCWWPLFIRLLLSWFWGKRPFLMRMLSTTWISAVCAGLFFLIGALDMYYYKKYAVSYGLLMSIAATVFIMVGGIKNEAASNRLLKA